LILFATKGSSSQWGAMREAKRNLLEWLWQRLTTDRECDEE
jgi:hypothetical protein